MDSLIHLFICSFFVSFFFQLFFYSFILYFVILSVSFFPSLLLSFSQSFIQSICVFFHSSNHSFHLSRSQSIGNPSFMHSHTPSFIYSSSFTSSFSHLVGNVNSARQIHPWSQLVRCNRNYFSCLVSIPPQHEWFERVYIKWNTRRWITSRITGCKQRRPMFVCWLFSSLPYCCSVWKISLL